MRRLKSLIAVMAMAVCLVLPAVPASAQTNVFEGVCKDGSAKSSAACQQKGVNPLVGPNGTLTKATRLFALLTGIAAVILAIISGLMYVTAAGDSGKLTSARNTLTYALIGLVVVAISQSLVVFVLNNL